MVFRPFILLSLFLFLSYCRENNNPNYSASQIQKSWKNSTQILANIAGQWDVIQKKQLTFHDIHKLSKLPHSDNLYKKILGYDPISLFSIEWVDESNTLLGVSIVEMSSPLDAWGAYSLLRNPNIPSYKNRQLTKPSEGFYLPGRLVVYRGNYLWWINHELTQLPLVNQLASKIIKKISNQPYDQRLIKKLPTGQLIRKSIRYYKKSLPNWGSFSQCVVGSYQPHGSLRIFICDMKSAAKSQSSFSKHYDHIQKEMGLGSPEIRTKYFNDQKNSFKVRYFFYNSQNYELNGIFHSGGFVFGIIGSNSERFCLALSNEILGNITL